MPTTATDTLIPHMPGRGDRVGVASCCSCSCESAGDVWWDRVGWVHCVLLLW